MPEVLKLKAGAKVPPLQVLLEGFEFGENRITANVSIHKIKKVMQHFIAMHNEPLFFILELPSNKAAETELAPGIMKAFHKDIYYMDGCSEEEALTILERVGDLLFNDGMSSFGFGGHESGDEIMFGKYNVLTIYSRNIEKFAGFFREHSIDETKDLVTAWEIFTQEHPGTSEIYSVEGKTVYDIPDEFKEWGMYFAERREA